MFFCLPILFGCQTRLKPEGEQSPRICPRCHNTSVFSAKSTTWFELFFLPVIPFSSKHIWLCGICQWSAPILSGQEPITRNPLANGLYEPPNQSGYQPAYLTTPQK